MQKVGILAKSCNAMALTSKLTKGMEMCRAITAELMDRVILNSFCTPVLPDSLTDYAKIVTRPMDLGTIERNLLRNKYQTTADWYADALLVFDNAISYHQNRNPFWMMVAEYGRAELQRLAVGLRAMPDDAWTAEVARLSGKLTELIANPPSAPEQRKRQWLPALRRRAENERPPSQDAIEGLVRMLNVAVKDNAKRRDLWLILKDAEQLTEGDITTRPLDVEKLQPVTQTMLSLYLSSGRG
jgi:hypothetical protein